MSIEAENNQNHSIYKHCGGYCCGSTACKVSTEDFIKKYGLIRKDTIIKALREGEWAIDWWQGDIREDKPDLCKNLPNFDQFNPVAVTYFMRVRHVGEVAVCGSWSGVCKMWDAETGCKYDWEHLPTGGRTLTQDRSTKYSKDIAAVDWFPYWNILHEIACMDEFNK